jgi:spermidine synthase
LRGHGRYLLPLTVFITGASVLIVEVLAVRILSPYYGNTIFTVSSVISVILLALSVGYWAGGVLADRRPSLDLFFGIILASGVLLLAFHALGAFVLPPLSAGLSLALGPLVSATLLFLVPALLLGMLSPFAVKLQSDLVPGEGVGRVAGGIFFWSTLGSITGSLLAGFVLIPRIGVNQILVATAVALVALGVIPLVVMRVKRARGLAALMAVALLAWWTQTYALQSPVAQALLGLRDDFLRDARVVYSADGVYQKITIYEGEYYGRPARFLLLDRSESGAMFLDSDDPAELVYDYTKYHALYKVFAPRVRRALVLGGGAYSVPKALLAEAPGADVDVAEIEPSFFDLAKRYFRVSESPRLHNYVQDGRRFLADSPYRYDLIFGDVYYSYFSVPPQFTTREFFALAKAKLAPDGVFVANMIGDLSRRQPSLIMAEIRTFQTVFPNSYFFAVDSVDKVNLVQNITLVGFNSDRKIDIAAPPVTTHPDQLIRFLRFKALDVARRFELSSYPVLTDDFSPVEYLTARVLQRSLNSPDVITGDEIRAVMDQLARYGVRETGASGSMRTRDFLAAETAVLAQEVTSRGDAVVARLSVDEPRRVALVASYVRSPAAVAVLIELMRGLINSPTPLSIGVDVVFEGGAAEPAIPASDSGRIDVEKEYAAPLAAGTPESLETIAQSLVMRLSEFRAVR